MSTDFDHQALFAAIDARDASAFAAFLHDDAVFCFGNLPPVAGREAIEAFVADFFAALDGIAHRIDGSWPVAGGFVCHGEVTYRRRDGSEHRVPFANVFYSDGGRVSRYLIFIDNSELFTPPGA